ncbi:hypothetical protein QR680_006165 [Steinernema hermaphroditum]|uniref:BTB domain-containing protein n=1 Tax=Steinernema hermaphroditum TaxID=289476 RepID=A0AA39HUL5_9BILA|nr:hypothetical protein QR680_006165 [Steinernema hermaphroditum]
MSLALSAKKSTAVHYEGSDGTLDMYSVKLKKKLSHQQFHNRSVTFMDSRETTPCMLPNIAEELSKSANAITQSVLPGTLFRLNVGGKSYRIAADIVLARRTHSLMTTLITADHEHRLTLTDAYLEESAEYYLERNTKITDHVIEYYVTGVLHKPMDTCTERFKEELDFWQLDYNNVAPCCSIQPPLPKSARDKEDLLRRFSNVTCGEVRRDIYNILEEPSSSIFAKLYSIFSIIFIFSSVAGLILGSMPEFQRDNSQAHLYHMMHQKSTRDFSNKPQKFIPVVESENATNDFVYKPTDDPANFLVVMEYICIAWFTVEYLLRLSISPRKRIFVMEPMNLIDLCTILPFYLEMGFGVFGVNLDRLHNITGAMLVIRVLRVLRMARVFKLARYSTGLQIFGHTLRSSLTELSMLGMFLLTGIVFFSTLIYFIEKDEHNTEFSSIPSACWWCVVTMTTIGYGDSIPKTTLGKVIATSASVCGIIVLAFPISMIVEKFACAQQKSHEESQIRQAHMAAMAQNYFLNRFTRRRKACKEPLASSVRAKLNGHDTPNTNGSVRSIA